MKLHTMAKLLSVFCMILLVQGLQGCYKSFTKTHFDGPYLFDDLSGGSSKGKVKGGTFVDGGWKPGSDGSITYDVPGVAQGAVQLTATGLNRSDATSVFMTLFETAEYDYAEPFVVMNPYLVQVSLNSFAESPQSPFGFLWTLKQFPAGTADENRYVAGLPLGGGGYEQTIQSNSAPVFPDSANTVRIEWRFGKAGLYFNGKLLAEHDYRPSVFNPDALKFVVGKTPGGSINLDHIVIKSVTVSLPGVE